MSRASLQAAVEKLKGNKIPEHTINELQGGLGHIINECEESGKEILAKKQQNIQNPPDSVVIFSTDKTKRLIALDTNHYDQILLNCTVNTGNYDLKNKLNKPKTEQAKFNSQLKKIADTYNAIDKKLSQDLKSNYLQWTAPLFCLLSP